MLKVIFWGSALVILYTYFGYPLILMILSILKAKPPKKKDITPSVSLVISTFNDGDVIKDKIENCLKLDYPKEKLEVVVGLDGSTDKTYEILKGYESKGVKLYKFDRRKGKAEVLNKLVPHAKGEIIVFSDAREMFEPAAVRELVSNFFDESIGCVSGELILETEEGSLFGEGVGLYWRYEKFLRRKESEIGSMLGATGAIYAIRKKLYVSPPATTVLDDVYIPMKIVQQGYRAIFEPRAKAFDDVAESAKEEYRRKVRTLAGNYQIFVLLKGMFNPFRSKVAWQFISHKLMRVLAPFFLIAALITNLFLMLKGGTLYNLLLIIQLLFYATAILGAQLHRSYPPKPKHWKLCSIPFAFCVLNFSALVGFYRFIRNKQSVAWEK